jgi:hypothetical protein
MAEDSLLIAKPGLVREKLALTGIAGGESPRPRVEIQIAPRDPPVRAPRSPRRWVPEGCPDTPPVRSGPCP